MFVIDFSILQKWHTYIETSPGFPATLHHLKIMFLTYISQSAVVVENKSVPFC